MKRKQYPRVLLCTLLLLAFSAAAQERKDILLNDNWKSIATRHDQLLDTTYYRQNVDDKHWTAVTVPHNWDVYDGYRRLVHGNRHGDSWYRRSFTTDITDTNKRFFLYFEGVGSYATVYVNGRLAGTHAGGRTGFTLDITRLLHKDHQPNLLAVRAWHPSFIKDLPWVCGGCSDDRGFSEGSQPMGIFRPVHLIVTNDIRVSPFGVHAWTVWKNDQADLHINTSLKNYRAVPRKLVLVQTLYDALQHEVGEERKLLDIAPNDSITVTDMRLDGLSPQRWAPAHPVLYRIETVIKENGRTVDKCETIIGFRQVSWSAASHQLLINGEPVFINGIAEYEHLLGGSHAFSPEEIAARFKWIKAAGFNAFRDAHQPHQLLYGEWCDKEGLLWWPQLSAHIWYDTPQFRDHFKQLLREWILERRNDPAVILWGLQNESRLPEDFAEACTALIRELDPTASKERLVTTCNGGTGTDWDVPQNWTGTYGGDPATYAADIKKQRLVGEYGAWRTLGLHDDGPFTANGPLTEDRMTGLMDMKSRLAISVSDSVAGQFFWLLSSHDNPGRIQGGEGLRELDRLGPVNYKGMLTPWEEPTDVFYMYRARFANKLTGPMLYIVSHTWPQRFTRPGKATSLKVYSNCDEIELFNDLHDRSFGRKKRNSLGHFQWDSIQIRYNVLYAEGYVNGKKVTADTIVLQALPVAPHFNRLFHKTGLLQPAPGYHYIYRINCGGDAYTDENGNRWLPDRALPEDPKMAGKYAGSRSWTTEFEGMPAYFGSQRVRYEPIQNTGDWPLFNSFRYGREKLQYQFPLPNGHYLVELYFAEPWLGIGGGMNASGMRIFDVSVNGRVMIKDLDIWKEAGGHRGLKKAVEADVLNGKLVIAFPHTKVGQAIISAIAIASKKKGIRPAPESYLIDSLKATDIVAHTWLDLGDALWVADTEMVHSLPAILFGADWLQCKKIPKDTTLSFVVRDTADIYCAMLPMLAQRIPDGFENSKEQLETNKGVFPLYKKRFNKGERVIIPLCRVFIVPASHMPPAYDLKKTIAFTANLVTPPAGTVKQNLNGKTVLVVDTDEPVVIEWPISTGVADTYSLTLKYYSPSANEISGAAALFKAGNAMTPVNPLSFSFTRPGKSNTVSFTTSGMINAGDYSVRISLQHAKGLSLSEVDVQ